MKKKISTMALVAVLATAAATTPVYASIQYPDINGHWSKNIVEKWAEANVVSGYPDGTFKPNDNITRAEFGVWVYKLFGYQPSSKDSKFADVNGHWAESIIDSLVEHGVIVNSEYGNNYGPDTKITRMEMIRMMVRAIEKQGETSGAVGATKFVDNASIAQKDTGFINVAAKYDIITGYPDGTLKPYAKSTRAEGAAMLVKLQKISEELPVEEPKPEEVKEPSSGGGGGGGSSKVHPATIDFTLAASSYVTDKEPVVATVGGATEVEWKLLKDGVQVDMDTYATASLTQNGGEITFKEPGDYELVGVAKNRRGVETTVSKKISVYPNAEMRLSLPDTTHTDRTAPFELTVDKIGKTDIEWTITDSDGKEIALTDVIVGELNGNTGLLQFKEAGEYTITAKTKDSYGKEFETAQTIKVYPVVYLDIDGQAIRHTDEKENITLKTKNLGDLDVVWTVTSNGAAVDLADIGTGTLDNTGGELQITTPGNYVFTATVTDETGREYTETYSVTVYPVGDVMFTIPAVFHTDTEVTVDAEFKELADNNITWTLLKDGQAVNIADYIRGDLTKTGGKIYVTQKGDYTLKASFTDGGGRKYEHEQDFKVYGIPEIAMEMPKTAHTDTVLDLNAALTNTENCKISWMVDNTYGFQDWATFIDGTFADNEGNIRFKHAGVYQLVAQVTDPTGRVFVFDQLGKCEVYPALDLKFTLPSMMYTDTTADIKTTGNIFNQPIDWTVTKDGAEVPLQDAVIGNLNELGGRIQFKETGEYTLKASITDATGRTFSYEQNTKVLPLITFDTTVGPDVKKNVPTNIVSNVKNIGDKTISWTLKKDGTVVDMDDYIEGELDNNGGSDIIFKEKGNYTLVATVTDEMGRIFTDSTDFTVTLMAPNAPEGIAYPTRKIKDQKLFVDFDVSIENPYQLDIHYEWKDMPEDKYFALGTHTVQVRAVNEDGAASEWVPVTFTLTNRPPSRPKIEGKPTGSSNNYISPSQMVNLTATGSKDPDGDTIHYVWENYNGTGQTYSNGKQLVKVKAVDAFGAESSQAAILFFVADETGGGMTLKDSTSFIHEPGVEGATITSWTYNVPEVSGHSGNDYGLVEGYNQNTKEWEQLDKVTTSNGVTMSGKLTPGVYTEMRFTYYTNHDCMYNKSNITYTVEFYFPDDEYSNITLTMPDKAYVGETVKAQATAENMTDKNLTWTVEKGGQNIPLSDIAVGIPDSSGGEFRFTQAGAYTVTITGKDNSGNTITDSQMIHVYDKTNLVLTLPEKAASGEKVQASLKAENLGMNSVTWTVEKDNQDIPLDSVAVGTPNNVGGTFRFTEPGTYTIKTVVTDKGGGVTIEYKQITIYPAAKLEIAMKDTANTLDKVSAMLTAENLSDINWAVKKDGTTVALSEVTQETPTQAGGTFIFKDAGEYTITVTGNDEGGKEVTKSHTITVLARTTVDIDMPDAVKKGTDVTASIIADNLGDKDVEWTVEKDGEPIDIADVTTETPDKTGGKFNFTLPGEYVIKALVTDGDGTTTSTSHTITVFEPAKLQLDMPNNGKTGEDITATLTTENIGSSKVEWSITKDGQAMNIADVTTGTPDNAGAKFNFTDPAKYEITVKTTDPAGDEVKETHTITVKDSSAISSDLVMTLPEKGKVGEIIPVTISLKNGTLGTVNFDTTTDIGEDYTISNKGNGSYELKFTSPGTYNITASTAGADGNTVSTTETIKVYAAVAPKVILSMPEYTHTDKILSYTNTDKNFYGYTVEWTVHDENNEVLDWDTYIDGQFDGASGQCRFKKPGVYTLHAKVTGPDGDVWTYDDFDSCTVYKAYYFDVVLLPEEIWTENYSFTFGTKGNASAVSDQMKWTIGIDGDTIELGNQDEFNELLEKHGSGEYTVTCSYTDASGREFSNSAKLKVNAGSPNSYLDIAVSKKSVSVNEDIVVTTELHNADGFDVEWNVIKDGAPVGYDGFMKGKLENNGGTIQFTEAGQYTICASITDSNGDSYMTYKSVTVTGIATLSLLETDETDEATVSIGGSMKGKVFIHEEKAESEDVPKADIQPTDGETDVIVPDTLKTPIDEAPGESIEEPVQEDKTDTTENTEQAAEGTDGENNLTSGSAAEAEQPAVEETSTDNNGASSISDDSE